MYPPFVSGGGHSITVTVTCSTLVVIGALVKVGSMSIMLFTDISSFSELVEVKKGRLQISTESLKVDPSTLY